MLAVQAFAHMTDLYEKFKHENPTANAQTFQRLLAYFNLHVTNISITQHGYSASAKGKSAESDRSDVAALAATVQDLALNVQKLTLACATRPTAAIKRGGGDGGRGRGRGGRGYARAVNSQYCYFHGYNTGHVGLACRHMAANPTKFTSNMIAVQNHVDVAGGSTFGHV